MLCNNKKNFIAHLLLFYACHNSLTECRISLRVVQCLLNNVWIEKRWYHISCGLVRVCKAHGVWHSYEYRCSSRFDRFSRYTFTAMNTWDSFLLFVLFEHAQRETLLRSCNRNVFSVQRRFIQKKNSKFSWQFWMSAVRKRQK